jgi:hypothetical protein
VSALRMAAGLVSSTEAGLLTVWARYHLALGLESDMASTLGTQSPHQDRVDLNLTWARPKMAMVGIHSFTSRCGEAVAHYQRESTEPTRFVGWRANPECKHQ